MSESAARSGSPRTLLDQIGNTPLLRLQRVTADLPPAVEVYVKAEWFNPGGSVKDRPVRRIIEDAERDGRLTRGQTILDSSSGNAGIAYAMIATAKGYRVRLVVPENVTEERKRILRAFGVEVQYSNPLEGSDGAILLARALARAHPAEFFFADQYNNPSNVRAHYETTGPEVHAQTGGRITHFVAGLGTTGTLVGAGRGLKKRKPDVKVCAVMPAESFHGLEGMKHIPTAIRPGIYDESVQDHLFLAGTEESYQLAERLAREEGMFVGHSSGAALVGAREVAKRVRGGVIVVVLPDGGDRYLSEIR